MLRSCHSALTRVCLRWAEGSFPFVQVVTLHRCLHVVPVPASASEKAGADYIQATCMICGFTLALWSLDQHSFSPSLDWPVLFASHRVASRERDSSASPLVYLADAAQEDLANINNSYLVLLLLAESPSNPPCYLAHQLLRTKSTSDKHLARCYGVGIDRHVSVQYPVS